MFNQGEKHVLEHIQLEYEEAYFLIVLHTLDALRQVTKDVLCLMTQM